MVHHLSPLHRRLGMGEGDVEVFSGRIVMEKGS